MAYVGISSEEELVVLRLLQGGHSGRGRASHYLIDPTSQMRCLGFDFLL
jgi:hypothetical protein